MSTALLRSPPEFRRGEKEREGGRRRKVQRGGLPPSLPPSLPPHHPPRAPPSKAGGGGRCVLSLDDKKRKARSRTITPQRVRPRIARGRRAGRADAGRKEAPHCDSLLSPVGSTLTRNLGRAKENGRTDGGKRAFLPFWPRLALFLLPPLLAFVSQYFSLPSPPLPSLCSGRWQ